MQVSHISKQYLHSGHHFPADIFKTVSHAIIFKTNTFTFNDVGVSSNIYHIEFSL
jgi:hypothetical protein